MYYYVYTMCAYDARAALVRTPAQRTRHRIRVVPVATRPIDDISPRGRVTFAVVSSVILSYLFTIISIASGAFYDYELDFIYRTGTRHQMLKAYYFLWALLSVTAIFVCTYYGGKLMRLLQQSIGSVEQTALIEADVAESAYLLTRRSALHKIRSTVFAGVAMLVFVGGTALAHSFWRIDIMTNLHLSRGAYVLSMLTAPAFLLIHHAAYLYGCALLMTPAVF